MQKSYDTQILSLIEEFKDKNNNRRLTIMSKSKKNKNKNNTTVAGDMNTMANNTTTKDKNAEPKINFSDEELKDKNEEPEINFTDEDLDENDEGEKADEDEFYHPTVLTSKFLKLHADIVNTLYVYITDDDGDESHFEAVITNADIVVNRLKTIAIYRPEVLKIITRLGELKNNKELMDGFGYCLRHHVRNNEKKFFTPLYNPKNEDKINYEEVDGIILAILKDIKVILKIYDGKKRSLKESDLRWVFENDDDGDEEVLETILQLISTHYATDAEIDALEGASDAEKESLKLQIAALKATRHILTK